MLLFTALFLVVPLPLRLGFLSVCADSKLVEQRHREIVICRAMTMSIDPSIVSELHHQYTCGEYYVVHTEYSMLIEQPGRKYKLKLKLDMLQVTETKGAARDSSQDFIIS
jgi:hypothetical protein